MRKSVLLVCSLALAVCLWLLLHRRTEAPGTAVSPSLAVVATSPAASPQAAVSAPAPSATAPAAIVPSPLTTNAPNTISPIAEMWQKPIDFYGKVIDETSNPVAGASIEFRWDDLTAKDWTRTATTTSDAEGLFSLHGGRGATLTVSASKAGYYSSPKDTGSYHYAVPNDNRVYSPDQGNPVVFHLWKKGQGAELMTSEHGMRSDLSALVPINGDPVSVDLLSKKIGTSGDLELSQVKPDRGHWQQATNWSFHMSIPAGGLIEEADAFPFTAPEAGYQSRVDLNFVKGEPTGRLKLPRPTTLPLDSHASMAGFGLMLISLSKLFFCNTPSIQADRAIWNPPTDGGLMTFYVKQSKDAEIEGPLAIEQINLMVREKRFRFKSLALADTGQGLPAVCNTPVKQWKQLADIPGFVPDPDEERNCLTIALVILFVLALVTVIGLVKLMDIVRRIE